MVAECGNEMMMTPGQRLKVKFDCNRLLESVRLGYPDACERFQRGERVDTMVYCIWAAARDAALYCYLLGRWQECVDWSRKVADASVLSLLGDWRETAVDPDSGRTGRDGWFGHFPADNWTMYLDKGLCWGAVGGHWDLVDRQLTFPERWVAEDYEGKVLRSYYLGLAGWWKNETDLGWIEEVKQLRGAGSKGVHLLCDAVAAISKRDAKATAGSLKRYVHWFLKRHDYEEGYFPIQAIFPWHVARRKGLTLELPEEIDIHLYRLPDNY